MERKILYYLDAIRDIQAGKIVWPVTCEIDPSNACMLDCEFCMFRDYLQKQRDCGNNVFLDVGVYSRLLNDLRDVGVKSITFTGGGEPLMHKDINAMIDMAVSAGMEVGLVTNGVLLERLRDPKVFKFIRVSLDAPNAEVYKKIKGKDFFDKVIANVCTCIDAGCTVGVSYVLRPDNEGLTDDMKALAEKIGLEYVQFKPDTSSRTPVGVNVDKGDRGIITERYVAKNLLPCHIAGLVAIVNADGNVAYCCQYRGPGPLSLGNLYHSSFKDIWARRNAITPDVSKCPPCRYMNYAKLYEEVVLGKATYFFNHRNFL